MTKQDVVAYKDDDFLILIAKDRFNGVRAQLYAYIETHQRSADGKIESLGPQPKLLEEISVPFFKEDPRRRLDQYKGALTDPNDFRKAVISAEAELKSRMETVYKRTEQMAAGVLNDLRGKYKDLNGSGADSI